MTKRPKTDRLKYQYQVPAIVSGVDGREWWQRLKICAAVRGLTVNQIMTMLLEDWVDEIESEIIKRYIDREG